MKFLLKYFLSSLCKRKWFSALIDQKINSKNDFFIAANLLKRLRCILWLSTRMISKFSTLSHESSLNLSFEYISLYRNKRLLYKIDYRFMFRESFCLCAVERMNTILETKALSFNQKTLLIGLLPQQICYFNCKITESTRTSLLINKMNITI